ncbi:MAG: hypothetical protein V7L24_24675 [Nostoc sp.]
MGIITNTGLTQLSQAMVRRSRTERLLKAFNQELGIARLLLYS